jgi:hypothetical protein
MLKTITLLIFILFLPSAFTFAQQSVLEKPITVTKTTGTVQEIVQELSQKGNVSFSYSNLLQLQQPVTLQQATQSLQAHLEQVLAGQPFKYMVKGNKIILYTPEKAKPKPSRQNLTISGYVREKGSGELLIGVSVYVPGTVTGTTSNTYGFYSLSLPGADSLSIAFSYVGYTPQVRKVALQKNVELNVELQPGMQLQEVVIRGEQQERVSQSVQMSTIDIPIAQIKTVPALMGEKDVLKVLQLMPGVKKGSEGNSGLYVRGGGPDQNLIILDDAVVYNAYHLFGFFSLFNGDALKSVELTKGGFPARYGGRLSSVIDMNMKEGNKEKLHGEGGIGLIASRLTVEGPLKKGKSSFLISGRRTYADMLMRPFFRKGYAGGYYFYDLNTKVNYDFGRKNKLYLSGYFGQDRFYYRSGGSNSKTSNGWNWGNATATLRWNHLFNEKLFANTSLIFSNYQFNIFSNEKRKDAQYTLDYSSGIRDFTLKYDVDFLPNPQHTLRFGLISTAHRFTPSALVVKDTELNKFKREKTDIDVVESGIYIEDTYQPFDKLKINAGFRLSNFATKNRQYWRPEPRVSVALNVKEDLSLKASYALMNQYIHLISNTGIGLPTDLWVPSTTRVGPQQSQQVAAGIAKDFIEPGIGVTLEGYYKKSTRILGYKEGASFLLIDDPESAQEVNWEDNITAGKGWSYGVELFVQKKVGRFSGWLGYTLSWTQLQFDSLNFGKKYYARYDRRHDISLVGIYKISPRITLSGTWVYGTGNAITLPLSEFSASHHIIPSRNKYGTNSHSSIANEYGAKNAFRMAAYHRLDIGIQFHKQKRWGERTWEISVYNVYSRQNPFYYYIGGSGLGERILKQVSLFPIIPSATYSFKF